MAQLRGGDEAVLVLVEHPAEQSRASRNVIATVSGGTAQARSPRRRSCSSQPAACCRYGPLQAATRWSAPLAVVQEAFFRKNVDVRRPLLQRLARASIQKAIIEHRLAEATNSRPQKIDVSVLKPGMNDVEIYKLSERKDDDGWRGLA